MPLDAVMLLAGDHDARIRSFDKVHKRMGCPQPASHVLCCILRFGSSSKVQSYVLQNLTACWHWWGRGEGGWLAGGKKGREVGSLTENEATGTFLGAMQGQSKMLCAGEVAGHSLQPAPDLLCPSGLTKQPSACQQATD